jgi:hypothetical protein
LSVVENIGLGVRDAFQKLPPSECKSAVLRLWPTCNLFVFFS